MKLIFDFLIRRFVKDYSNVKAQTVRQSYGALGGKIGVVINSSILILELTIGLFLNSIAIMADAFHNLTDALSSVITIFSFKLSNRPADDKHPFGYGRIEYLTALLFSAAIFVVGYEFIKNSINRILNPVNVKFNLVSFLCMLIALPLQIFLNRFTTYIGKIIDSSALQASALESFTDILVLAMVIFSILITKFTAFPVDGYVGIIVSIFILHSGFELGKDMIDTLLGKAPDKEFIEELTKSVLEYPIIKGVHDLVIHNYGPGRYIASLHAEVPYNVPIMEIHDCIDKVEKEIGEKFNIYLSIHMDPIKTDAPEIKILQNSVMERIHQIDGILSMHDFRVVGDNDEKTLIFDAVVEKKYFDKEKNELIKKQIQEAVWNICPTYRCIITIDREFH